MRRVYGFITDSLLWPPKTKCPYRTDFFGAVVFLPFLIELQSKATLVENPGSEN